MNNKESYALGYYYGRSEGSYLFDLDSLSDTERYEFKLGYDSGVADYCLIDIEEITE